MRIRPCLAPFLACSLSVLLSVSAKGQTDDSDSPAEEKPETVAELVRVKPADIGPKKGTGELPASGEGETDEAGKDGADAASGETTQPADGGAALEVIFDCSNSMNAPLGGVAKINLARQALFHLTDTLGKTDLQVGLRLFGHDRNIDREDRVKGCTNSELVIPIAADTIGQIRARIPSLTAWGRTPIAYSLEQAGSDLNPHLENSPMILLISDGLESCGGDPVKSILALRDRGVKVRAFVIGFDISADERAALEQIAAAGDGRYYDAANYGELLRAFDQFASDVAIAPKPVQEKYTNPAQGGADFENATLIGPGRYTVWKDLAKGEWGYFKVDSSKGQRVAVRAVVQGKAIYRDDKGEFHEAKYSEGGAMIRFYDPQGEVITGRNILLRGQVGEWQRQHTLDVSGEGSYFAVGDDYGPTSRHVMFEVIVQEAGDLYEGWEAPDAKDSGDIFEAPLNDAFYGHLGTEDRFDLYRFDLKGAGNPAALDLSIAFSDVDEPCKFLIEAYDAATMKRFARFTKLESKADLQLETEGLDGVVLSIKDNNPKLYHLMNSYQLEMKTAK